MASQFALPSFADDPFYIVKLEHEPSISYPDLLHPESHIPNIIRSRPSGKKRVRKSPEPGKFTGHWSLVENKLYHLFLQIHHLHFQHSHMRRMDKIFKKMADFVGTRAAHQCRSHHQKMQKKYTNFMGILYNLRVINYKCIDTLSLEVQIKMVQMQLPSAFHNNWISFDGWTPARPEVKCEAEDRRETESENLLERYLQEESINELNLM